MHAAASPELALCFPSGRRRQLTPPHPSPKSPSLARARAAAVKSSGPSFDKKMAEEAVAEEAKPFQREAWATAYKARAF